MATNRAIVATSTAIVSLLSRASQRDPQAPQCKVTLLQAEELHTSTDQAVVGVVLYRVGLSDEQTNPGLPMPGGPHSPPPIAVDLHYLVTVLVANAAASQRLLGWAISVLNENPVFAPSALNTFPDTEPVFKDGEEVVLVWEPLSPSEVRDVWHLAGQQSAPSATYVVRDVRIDPQAAL